MDDSRFSKEMLMCEKELALKISKRKQLFRFFLVAREDLPFFSLRHCLFVFVVTCFRFFSFFSLFLSGSRLAYPHFSFFFVFAFTFASFV